MFTPPVSDRTLPHAAHFGAHADHSFNKVLRQADFGASSPPGHSPSVNEESPLRIQAREAARALVASAFLIPMLASVRDASFAAGPYAPTVAERRFGPMIDQQIADRVMQGTNFALIDSIVDRIAGVDTTA